MPEQAPELIELIQNTFAAVDLQFQFWLSITFAAVVASFLARDHLGTRLRIALAALYGLSTLQILLVSLSHLESGAFLSAELRDLGVAPPRTLQPVVGVVRRLVFGLGTLGAIVYILWPGLVGEGEAPPPVDMQQD